MTDNGQIVVFDRDNPLRGDYLKLQDPVLGDSAVAPTPWRRTQWRRLWLRSMVVVSSVCLFGAVGFFAVRDGFPFVLGKVVTPTLNWEGTTFSKPMIGLLLFASMAVFPVLLVPTTPSMWISGITFGYGYGFLLIISSMSLGMSLPFIIGSQFYHRINLWLVKWPQKASITRLASKGDWFHQLRMIALLRISPFPYVILNYVAAVTDIKYYPYIFGSLIGVIPDIFLTMFSGIMTRSLADVASSGGTFSAEQIIYDIIGFCIAVAATVAFTIYARRSLQRLQAENQMELLQ